MKDWILGRRLMDAADDGGGGGGQGGGEGQGQGQGQGQGDGQGQGSGDQNGGAPADQNGGEGNNALGDDLKKGGAGDGGGKPKEQTGAPAAKPEDAPTEEEAKAYKEALKLDEEAFGKGVRFDERYVERLPSLFKRHGIAPDKANALANDFAKLQKEVEKETAEKVAKFREWRQGEMKKMNDAYHSDYDQAGRADIARAIRHFFPEGSPMYQAVCMTEVGVDPGFLKAMKFIGERLPRSASPGAASGAGAAGGKDITDLFMGK